MINVTSNRAVGRAGKGLAVPPAAEIPAPPKLRLPQGHIAPYVTTGLAGANPSPPWKEQTPADEQDFYS